MDTIVAYEEVACQIALIKSDLETRRAQLLAPIAPDLAALDEEYTPALEAAQARLEELAGALKEMVSANGKTIKGELYQAVFVKGRESWDGAALKGYAAVHPEIMQFKSVAAPTVQIRANR
jgi:phage host-nuclease inhibitor protein Gam